MADHNSSRVVNYGAYGLILSPALPNDPPYENDPHSMITKVFYRKEDYDALRQKERRLAKILGVKEEGYRFQPYERTFRTRNLPSKAQEILADEADEADEADANQNQSFSAVRMLHLGTSVSALKGSPEGLEKLRSCSTVSLVAAIQKVYQTLASLAQHRTLHGDVHSGNVLFYLAPPYCDLSLIDYDRFSTYDEFRKEYEQGRRDIYGGPEIYSLLPEGLREDPWILRSYLGRFLNHRYVDRHYPKGEWAKRVQEVMTSHGDKPVSLHTADSFLLSSILLDLLYRVYPFLESNASSSSSSSLPPQEERALRDMVDVLEEGFRLTGRIGPDEIVTQLQRIKNRLEGKNQEEQKQKNQENKKACQKSKKNQENKGCAVMGGAKRRRTQKRSKRRIISRKGRR